MIERFRKYTAVGLALTGLGLILWIGVNDPHHGFWALGAAVAWFSAGRR